MKHKHLYFLFIIPTLFWACSQKSLQVRQTLDFNEGWQFILADSIADYSAINVDASSWRTLDLPHDWSIESDFSDAFPATPGGGALPGGIGWYRKSFQLDNALKDKQIYIDFDGVYQCSEVWINGHSVGFRPNGYISFRYDLTPYINWDGENIVAVRVDNSRQPNSRWYSGSGIYRNVRLTITNPVHVDLWGIYVTTPVVNEKEATIQVQTTVRNTSSLPVAISHTLYDAKGKKIAAVESMDYEQSFTVSNPILWSVENPYLYKLVTTLKENGKVTDEYETQVGIRFFEFNADKGFILNGKQVKINGVCNHHDLGCLGAAVNYRALERQLQILKEMGCNGIRCSHNPPAPELLKLCDQMGFIVMDEAFDMWRKQKTTYDYSQYFPEWYERDLTDLILRDRNHPSVFMWSIGNEVLEQWTHAGTEILDLKEANILLNNAKQIDPKEFESGEVTFNMLLTQRLAEITRTIDPTRPVTAGCNETRTYNHLFRSDALDIIGFNYHIEDFTSVPEIFPGKPFIVAESVSGSMSRGFYLMPSDSIYIWPKRWDIPFDRPVKHCSSYDNNRTPWGSNHEENWKEIKKHDFISGQYIWTGFDYLGEPTPFWWPARSSYFGIIDLAGFPKDIYYMYQSEWTDKKVLHVFPHWNWEIGETVDIWAYYNQADEVELFLDGKSLGIKKKENEDLRVWWRVTYEPGELVAISRKDGQEVLSRTIRTTSEPVAIRLTADRSAICATGKDLSFITAEVIDKDGNAVPTAGNLIRFSVEGPALIAGTDNGDPTGASSLKHPERQLFNGKCLAVIQGKKQQGTIKVKATADGLKESVIEVRCGIR